MKIKNGILMALILIATKHSIAQFPKFDKIKLPAGKTKGDEKSAKTNNQSSTSTESSNSPSSSNTIEQSSSSSGGALTQNEQESWYNFYKNVTQECESRVWIDGMYEGYFLSAIENYFDKLAAFKWICVDLETKIENDKKRSPETFKFYGNKNDMPEGMEYGGANSDVLASKLKWTNNSVTKYYKWKINVKKDQAGVAKSIAKYIEASQERISANAELNTRIAYEYILIAKELCSYFEKAQGKSVPLTEVTVKTEAQRLAIINGVKSKLTGKFHENNLQKVIAFSKKQILGKESDVDVSTELIPGKFSHIIAYAVEPLNRFGAKSSLSTGGRETLPSIYLTFNNSSSNKLIVNQKIYCNTELFNTMKDKFYVEFEWFPDMATVNYKSHLEYMPIMHLGQYLLKLQNGKYNVNMLFGNNIHTDIGSRGSFVIVMNDEIRSNLKNYLEKLWIKKLESVTFNSQYGDKDQRNIIYNVEELKKYGYLEKLSVERTGKVMKPWPNDKEVESFVGSGWGLFKRDDGKYEVIGLGFVQKPGDQKWKWTSIASDMDYYVLTETGGSETQRVQPQKLEQGYEINTTNIQKNGVW